MNRKRPRPLTREEEMAILQKIRKERLRRQENQERPRLGALLIDLSYQWLGQAINEAYAIDAGPHRNYPTPRPTRKR